MRVSAVRTISRPCSRNASRTGAFSILFSASSRRKIGVSMMPSRIHSPIPTSPMLSANGMRQPQT
jgi:hypothetical protein